MEIKQIFGFELKKRKIVCNLLYNQTLQRLILASLG